MLRRCSGSRFHWPRQYLSSACPPQWRPRRRCSARHLACCRSAGSSSTSFSSTGSRWRTGCSRSLQDSIGGVTEDRRLQLLLIAFSFGAFFEGAAGFGTPVAVTGAILIGLGFSPLAASGLSLIANTAPWPIGALGTPIIALARVTGHRPYLLGAMVGRQLPFFSLIVPFWLMWAFAGWRGMMQVWPAILVAGVCFAIPQFLISNFINPWLVDIGASLVSMACLIAVPQGLAAEDDLDHARRRCRGAQRRRSGDAEATAVPAKPNHPPAQVWRRLLPWIILCVIVLVWGTGWFKHPRWDRDLPGIPRSRPDKMMQRCRRSRPSRMRKPRCSSSLGCRSPATGMLIAAIISGFLMGVSFRRWSGLIRPRPSGSASLLADHDLGDAGDRHADPLLRRRRHARPRLRRHGRALSLLRHAARLAGRRADRIGHGVERAVRQLQKITSEQLGLSPILMGAANFSGGVMGKMIDAQSIVVASTATNWLRTREARSCASSSCTRSCSPASSACS